MPVKPVKNGIITSPYGERKLKGKKEFHPGVDIGAKEIRPLIYCPYNGMVKVVGFSESYGNRVWIQISEGKFKGKYLVLGHLNSITKSLTPGMEIKEDTVIGEMGNTGKSYGQHLHLGIMDGMVMGSKSNNPDEITELYEKSLV